MGRTIAFIQARTSSTRLPNKILMKFGESTILESVILRVSGSKKINEIAVLTSDCEDDDQIVEICNSNKVLCFRGPLNDVLARFYLAALAFDKPDTIVRITADCPFVDPSIIDKMLEEFEILSIDYLANTAPPPGTFPDGFDVEIFTFTALEKAYKQATLPSEREHVTFYFWKSGKFRTSRFDHSKDLSSFRFTIDYIEDYILLEPIHRELVLKNSLFKLEELLEYVFDNNIELPNFKLRNTGWKISLKKDLEYLSEKKERE